MAVPRLATPASLPTASPTPLPPGETTSLARRYSPVPIRITPPTAMVPYHPVLRIWLMALQFLAIHSSNHACIFGRIEVIPVAALPAAVPAAPSPPPGAAAAPSPPVP